MSSPARIPRRLAKLAADPVKSAEVAGLRYVCGGPGILRKRSGRGFLYVCADGKPVRDLSILRRIHSLVIPPAWQDVWICPSPNGHLQAVGRDARGRKQYRYHSRYRLFRNLTKFDRMTDFAAVLPAIRDRVDEDLRLTGLPKARVLAAVVRLLELTFIRVGNDEYVRANDSYGLTTLRNRHVRVKGARVEFDFRGKSGQEHRIEVDDPRLARIVKRCRDLPGYELFQYIDERGERSRVDSADVNEYLREITGRDFTAKDFRTWAGTVLVLEALAACGPADSQTQAKQNVVGAVKSAAARLGNRPATCRAYYVHPAVLESYQDGTLFETLQTSRTREISDGAPLASSEQAVLAVIKKHTPAPAALAA